MVEVKVCLGTHCSMMGGLSLFETLQELQQDYPNQIDVEGVKCLGDCSTHKAPVVSINDKVVTAAQSEKVMSEIMKLIEKR